MLDYLCYRWNWKATTVSLLVGFAVVIALYTAQDSFKSAEDQVELPGQSIQDLQINYASPRKSEDASIPTFCDALDVSKIAISIKTGATEARNKIPTQLMTFLRCIPDPMIFSDLQQRIGSHNLEDVLSGFSRTQGNADFNLYRTQRHYAEQGRETELGRLDKIPIPFEDWRTAGKNAAWGLDKYKFLPMIKRAWERQPGKDWYVFIEADTYVSISNLLRFLDTQDPKPKLYFGNGVRMFEHNTPLDFAHGGSGFILSGATVEAFAQAWDNITHKFTPARISEWWYGDFVVADALDEELNIQVTDITPMINADEPTMLPFDRNTCCRPVITLHHLNPKQFDDMYKFPKARNFSELLFRDVYAATYKNGLPLMGELWDNASDDRRYNLDIRPNNLTRFHGGSEDEELSDPHNSYKACEAACDQNGHCFQFSYVIRMKQRDDGGLEASPKCHLSRVFRFGREVKPDGHAPGTQWTSGWRTDRIRKFIEENQECTDADFGLS